MSSMSGDPSSRLTLRLLRICVLSALPWLLLPCGLPLAGAVVDPPSTHVVTGTLAMIDLSTGKGMIKTDLGKPIFFQISRSDQFSHLSIGNMVTIQLDDEGRAVKVIEALPSELSQPPQPPAR